MRRREKHAVYRRRLRLRLRLRLWPRLWPRLRLQLWPRLRLWLRLRLRLWLRLRLRLRQQLWLPLSAAEGGHPRASNEYVPKGGRRWRWRGGGGLRQDGLRGES